MEKLLPYFMQELAILRRNLRELVRSKPEMAAKLALADGESADPGIERVVQGTALLCAQQAWKLDHAHDRFTSDLLENTEPFYLRPLPSCSIAQVQGTDERTTSTIPRGTSWRTRATPACRFRTVYDVTLAPLAITAASFVPCIDVPADLRIPDGTGGAIKLTIDSTEPARGLDELGIDKVRVFVDADAATRTALYDALLARTLCTCVESDQQWRKLAALPLTPVGYRPEEAMLPVLTDVETGLRLWAEYFAMPEKFDFFDIDLHTVLAHAPPGARSVTLHLILPDLHETPAPRLLETLSAATFRLGCTPVINLFERPAEPVRLVKGRKTYQIVVPRAGEAEGTFYRIDSAQLTGNKDGQAINARMAALNVGLTRQAEYLWLARLANATTGTQDEVTIVDRDEQPVSLQSGTVDMRLTCTNGDLPASLPIGHADGDLTGDQQAGGRVIRLLRQPTRPCALADRRGGQWDLIRTLAWGYGCHSRNMLVEMLGQNASADCAVAQRQLSGIVAVHRTEHMKWTRYLGHGLLAYGLEVAVTIDESAFAQRSIFVFARLLDDYYARCTGRTNFTRVVLRSTSGAELLRCAERMGEVSPL
ncbi:type VI secretion system protein ImpG [Pseudoduganella flava]|uniref:Type VI secretion system baseplate subunit TssF n=1 Tax=Pseudoduganella flava TaxID=871742 RepID=A0A562PC80_9BURK|nr:type VI secretion system baseplate subunit TssF [Pseudoduganella flava]QGZ40145.1 type VI secretion system baseplate subunit TssF [Pseudoduganella flava]TWI42095.1 type VI secretion system protein ImpG [Pseudoduganella flava]